MSPRLIDVTLDELAAIVRDVVREELARQRPQEAAPTRYLTVAEAARIAGRSQETIREWVATGRLRALPRRGRQHIRIHPDDLEAALQSPGRSDEVDAQAWARGILRRVG